MNRAESVPNPVDIHVGARVRMRRKLKGLSQSDLADAIGLTFQQVQKYERGSNRISASKLYDISQYLNVSVEYFFEDYASANPGVDHEGETSAEKAVSAFLRTPEGITLAQLFPRVKTANQRRKILSLVESMTEE